MTPTIWDLDRRASIRPKARSRQASIGQIRFNDDGSFNVIGGGTNALVFDWNGISPRADRAASTSALRASSTASRCSATRPPSPPPTRTAIRRARLLDPGFDSQGQLVGYYSNGQTQVLDTLRVSMFSNEGGLLKAGDTMWVESPNSGDAIATTASAAGAGTVRAGQLENSNVDIAREFVNLIEAQRGFQANSRVITTTDQILAELMNIVR
jgi:flagellar hook protein FlgE